jgi:hypothetical protein
VSRWSCVTGVGVTLLAEQVAVQQVTADDRAKSPLTFTRATDNGIQSQNDETYSPASGRRESRASPARGATPSPYGKKHDNP